MNYDPSLQVPPEIIEAANNVANWAKMNLSGDYWEIGPVCDRRFAYDANELMALRYTEDWKPLRPGDPGYATAAYETMAVREINPAWKALESSGQPYWNVDSTGKVDPFPANPPPAPNQDGDGWQQRGD